MADEQDAPDPGDDPEGFLRSILDQGDDGTGAGESDLPPEHAPDAQFLPIDSPLSKNIEDRRTTLNDDPEQPGRSSVPKWSVQGPGGGWDTIQNVPWYFADGGAVPEEATPDDGWAPVDQPAPAPAQAAAPAAPPQDDGWAPVDQPTAQAPADDGWTSVDAPQPEGVAKTIGRKVLSDALPFAGSIPAMVEGAGLGAAAGIPLDPFTFGGASVVGGFLGGAAGGLGAGWLLTAAQDKIKSMLGIDDSEQRAVNAQAHSTAEMVADIGEMAAGFKVGSGLNLASRAITAGGMGGLDAAQQLASTGTVDPKEVAEQAALGAIFNEPRSKRLADPFGRHTPAAPTPGRPDLQGDQDAKEDVHVAPPPAGAPGVSADQPKPAPRAAGDAIGGDDGFRAVGSERDLAKDATPKSNAETVTQGDLDPATQAALADPAIQSMAKPRPDQKPLTPPADTGLAADKPVPAVDLMQDPNSYVEPDEGPPQRPEGAQAAIDGRPPEPAPKNEGIPFMVTKGMKAQLAERGFSPEDIKAMTPAQAHENLKAPEILRGRGGSGITARPGNAEGGFKAFDQAQETPEPSAVEAPPAPGEVPPSAQQATDPSKPFLPNVKVERAELPPGYIARSDDAGTKVYLAPSVPEVLEVNGHQVPVTDAMKVHEIFERRGIAVLQKAIAEGRHPPMSDDKIYAVAHEKVGTAAERAYLEEHVGTPDKPFTDADFATYQKKLADLAHAQKGGQPPADLYRFMDEHEGKLHLHTPDAPLNEVLPGDAKAQAEFEGKAAPEEDKFAAALRDFHTKPADVTATVIPGLKPALKLIAEHPGLAPHIKAEMTEKLKTASPEAVAKVYEGLRPKARAKVKVGTDEIQVRPANRARVEKITGAVKAAFERAAPKDDKLPVGKAGLEALKARLQDGVDHATSEAGVDPFAPATYAEGDTKKRNATGGGYRPAKLPAEYQWLRAAKEALKGKMTEAKAQKFLAAEKVLRSGNVEAVDEARAEHRADADKNLSKNGGDEAVESAEGRAAAVDPYAEEDAMIERLDAARDPQRTLEAFDVPHEEGEQGRTAEPITSKEDLERFAAKADEKPFDLSKMTPEEIGQLAEDMAKEADDKKWKNAEEERIAKIAEKSANLRALRLARTGAVPLRPEVEKRARSVWSERQVMRGDQAFAPSPRPTSRKPLDMGASEKILKNLSDKYPEPGSWINRPPGQLMWRSPIVKDATKKLGFELRSPTTRKGAAEEEATRAVAERLNMLDQSKAARNTWLNADNKAKLKAMGATYDDLTRLYHAIENKSVAVLPERIKAMYHQVIEPLLRLSDTLRENVKKLAPELAGTDVENHLKRIARNYMEREDARAGEIDPITGVRGISLSQPKGGKERAFYALTDTKTGNRTIISPTEGGYTTWRNGQAGTVKDPDFKFKEGELYTKGTQQFTMDQARTAEIMQHGKDDLGRKMDYHTNAYDSAQLAVREWGDLADALQHMERLKQSPEFKKLATLDKDVAAEKGWQKLGDGGPPQFRDYWMDAHLKEQMEQYSRPGIWGVPDALRNFAQGLTKTIYWTPTTHIFNHGATWFMGRGWDNFTPAGMHSLLVDGAKAIRAVAFQDKETYQRLQRAGLKLEFAPMMDAHMMEKTMDDVRGDMAKRPQKWEKIAKVFGVGVPELSDAIYHQSNKALWSASDVFTIQRALELERKGMSTQKAIDETHKYIPSYRIPSRIFTGGTGGAFGTKLVTEPTLVVFGRYHWAVMNGLAHMVRDITSGDKNKTLEGVGHLMALGMMAYFVKPALDKAAQMITGNKEAEVRPFGPLTMPSALVKAGKAQSDPQQALRDAATLSPMAETALNLYHNRDFTGRKIIEPGDVSKAAHGNLREAGKVAVQAGVAAARGTIAPLNSAMNSGQDGVAGMVRDQMLSIKNPSPAAQKFLRQAQQKGNAAANARERKPPNAIEKAYDRLTK